MVYPLVILLWGYIGILYLASPCVLLCAEHFTSCMVIILELCMQGMNVLHARHENITCYSCVACYKYVMNSLLHGYIYILMFQ